MVEETMMSRPIFYFHGLNSSPNTDKVTRLKEHFSDVYAFQIDPDPAVSLPYLRAEITKVLTEYPDESPIFVGTSLGGWYASELGREFKSSVVAINPSYAPQRTLPKLGISPEICAQYHDMAYPAGAKYFIGKQDEVIDFTPIKDRLDGLGAVWVEGAGHRFNGAEFDLVVDFIRSDKERDR
jgi:pimeloyl-ACP methyl ester carboxylesterase